MSRLVQIKQIEGVWDLIACCREAKRVWDWKSGLLGTTGLNSGTTNGALLDGSGTPQELYMESHATKDTRITAIQIELLCNSPKYYYFGGLPYALTNGVDLLYTKDSESRYIITAGKTNGDLEIQTGMQDYIQGGEDDNGSSTIFENWVAGYDLMVAYVDIVKFMGGFILRAGEDDRLSFVINDDLTYDSGKLNMVNIRIMGADSTPLEEE